MAVPTAPVVNHGTVTATTAFVYVATPPLGGPVLIVRYRIHRIPDGLWMGDLLGGYEGVTYTNLTHTTQYNVFAAGENNEGTGSWSAPVSFATGVTTPTISLSYTATDITRNSARIKNITVFDTGGAQLTNIAVQYSVTANNVAGAIVYAGGWTEPTLTGLTGGTLYYFRLAAINTVGQGPWGQWRQFTTLLGVPSDMAAPTFSLVTDTSLRVSWVAPPLNGSTFLNYRYEVSLTSNFTALVASGISDGLFVDVASLLPGTRYYARVRANATPSNGGYGAANQLTTGITPYSGIRVYSVIGGVVKQGALYAVVGGTVRAIKPMIVIGGQVQTE